MLARRLEMAMTKPRTHGLGWDGKAVAVAVIWALSLPVPVAFGDPPPWAPAHGWRAKHDPLYLGYTGKKWGRDYGVLDGRCNRQAVGAVLGAAVGGVIGSQVGKGDDRQVATILGTVLGAVAGASIGRDMDEKDRACLGHTLELGGVERDVAWTNADHGVAYRVIPLGGYTDKGRSCREFVTRISAHSRNDTIRHKACSTGDGVWRIVG